MSDKQFTGRRQVIVIGSAPGARAQFQAAVKDALAAAGSKDNVKIIAVNAAYSLAPDGFVPDVYVLNEKRQVIAYSDKAKEFFHKGARIFAHRKHGRHLDGTVEWTPVDINYVYNCFDVQPETMTNRGTGILAGLIAAYELGAEDVRFAGVTGYAEKGPVHEKDLARDDPSYNPDPRWRKKTNLRVRQHMAHIAKLFPKTHFIFYGSDNQDLRSLQLPNVRNLPVEVFEKPAEPTGDSESTPEEKQPAPEAGATGAPTEAPESAGDAGPQA